jgi:hypothetical protein
LKFENTWIAKYPKAFQCNDNGREFNGAEFQQLLLLQGIHEKPTTIKNLQANE